MVIVNCVMLSSELDSEAGTRFITEHCD